MATLTREEATADAMRHAQSWTRVKSGSYIWLDRGLNATFSIERVETYPVRRVRGHHVWVGWDHRSGEPVKVTGDFLPTFERARYMVAYYYLQSITQEV